MRKGFFNGVWRSKPVIFVVAVLSILTAGLAVAGLLSGSDSKGLAHESTYERYDSGFVIAQPGSYDSVDTAVVKEIDADKSRITFMNIETGRYYTLDYDGTTVIQDKHNGGMSMAQIQNGDIVDVTFLRGKKKLAGMKLSESAWVLEEVEKYSFDLLSKNAEIGGGTYSLRNNLVISSEGRDAQLEDIIRGDVVSISGIGNSVYSVVVEEGHGYLRLSNDEYLKGGWIEVGQSVIQQITEDMLLVVPEGTYNVHLTAGGIDETRQITVYRNQESVLDVSDVKAEEPKTGKILFAVTPSDTVISIDGKEVDISSPVEIEYGIHQMVAKAEGYETITQYIKVSQELASISISLEEALDGEDGSQTDYGSSVSSNELNSAASAYKVYIDSPSDVEVYVDGIYIGMSPVSFKKDPGTHTITLRKPGYVTKSYTVQIDDEEKDVTYSFTDLVKESINTISGNTVSSNNTAQSNNAKKKDKNDKTANSSTSTTKEMSSSTTVSGN